MSSTFCVIENYRAYGTVSLAKGRSILTNAPASAAAWSSATWACLRKRSSLCCLLEAHSARSFATSSWFASRVTSWAARFDSRARSNSDLNSCAQFQCVGQYDFPLNIYLYVFFNDVCMYVCMDTYDDCKCDLPPAVQQ